MKILFIDPCCPVPYTAETVKAGSGGTEATVATVATGLALKHDVAIIQHNRTVHERIDGVEYLPNDHNAIPSFAADVCIVLRTPEILNAVREQYPKCKLFLWCHDLPSEALKNYAPNIVETQAVLICVSRFHKSVTHQMIARSKKEVPIHVIYPPIADDLVPDGTPVDRNKLVFFSSPHKGLKDTLECFTELRRSIPEMTLTVSNPGYYNEYPPIPDGVTVAGTLTKADVIKHVRESLCVFYINTVFPETFGLVYAEANAVGTPVLTHQLGAANEVLDHPAQVINVLDTERVIGVVKAWRDGKRPIVRAKPMFRLRKVLAEWEYLLKI